MAQPPIEWTHEGFVLHGTKVRKPWQIVTLVGSTLCAGLAGAYAGLALGFSVLVALFIGGVLGGSVLLTVPAPDMRCEAGPTGLRISWTGQDEEPEDRPLYWPDTVHREGDVVHIGLYAMRMASETDAQQALELLEQLLATREGDAPDAMTARMRRLRATQKI